MKPVLPEVDLDPHLLNCLHTAVGKSVNTDGEERGGWLLYKKGIVPSFDFVPIHNDNHGLPIARVLFNMNKEEVGKNVVLKLCSGWDSWGSFHVHPDDPMCSTIDATKLFLGFKRNYIYGMTSRTMIQYQRVNVSEIDDLVDEQQVIWYPINGDVVIWKLSYVRLRISELPEPVVLADSSADSSSNTA